MGHARAELKGYSSSLLAVFRDGQKTVKVEEFIGFKGHSSGGRDGARRAGHD